MTVINEEWQQAVRSIDTTKMKDLLEQDPALVKQNIVHTRGNGTTYEKSPLRMVNSSIEAARLLIAAGHDPNDGADSVLAIHHATLEVATLILDSGADINRIGYEQGTALMYESGHTGNIDVVRLLIDRGADLNVQRSLDGNTALHFAVIKERPEIVGLLLASGANRRLKNNEGQIPLDIAKANNTIEIVEKFRN